MRIALLLCLTTLIACGAEAPAAAGSAAGGVDAADKISVEPGRKIYERKRARWTGKAGTPMPVLVNAHDVKGIEEWRTFADEVGFIVVGPTCISNRGEAAIGVERSEISTPIKKRVSRKHSQRYKSARNCRWLNRWTVMTYAHVRNVHFLEYYLCYSRRSCYSFSVHLLTQEDFFMRLYPVALLLCGALLAFNASAA